MITSTELTKRELETLLKQKLATQSLLAKWALTTLYEKQTESEKITGANSSFNGEGFGSYDSSFLTSLAEQYLSRRWLSPRQMAALHKAIPKYWKQVLDALGSDRLDAVLNDTFVPEPSPKSTATEYVQIHQDVRRALQDVFPKEKVIERWSPMWLRGSFFDFAVPGASVAVDITETDKRPINTPYYRRDSARKGAFAVSKNFRMLFVRADKPDSLRKLRQLLNELPKPHSETDESDTLFDVTTTLPVEAPATATSVTPGPDREQEPSSLFGDNR